MLASELDFDLPPAAVAQMPAVPRDSSKLLRLQCARLTSTPGSTPASIGEAISHHIARDLAGLLRPDDLLVFNDTRVLRARLHGKKPSGGRVEMLLLKEHARNVWEALIKPSARLREGGEIVFGNGEFRARLEKRLAESWRVQFLLEGDVREYLTQHGEVPLPPYIKSAANEEQYQTVYSRAHENRKNPLDSCAAPTAGLHFTNELLEALKTRGVRTCFLTLGVGAGTFRPVQTETLEEHAMHAEEFEVSEETAQEISAQKQRGARVIAVGTTTTRVLESLADESGNIAAGFGSTSIFIRPGFRFRCVDGLLTNFHLPRSTLLALVAAFIENRIEIKSPLASRELTGLEIVRYAYAAALAENYRFFSFGDAMLIE